MYNTMEVDVPQRWLQVSAITERLRSFTGKAIKNKLANRKYMGESNKWFALHRLDQPQYVVHLNDEQYEEWSDLKHELKNMYQEEFPPKHIQITFFRDGDAPYSRKTSITEWDPSIPQDTSIEQDSPSWNKLITLVAEDDPDAHLLFNLVSGSITHVKVKLLKDIARPKGKLINRRVRDGTQAIPSHPFLQVEWTAQGFLPKNQPLAARGDCLPRAIVLALKKKWDVNYSKIKRASQYWTEPLSISTITKFCKCNPEMSVPELQPFLEFYRVGLHVYDTQGKQIYLYDPPSRTRDLDCSIYILLHNNHVTLLNHNLDSIQQKDSLEAFEIPSKHFQMGKMDGSPIVIKEFEDLKTHIINAKEYTRVYYTGSVDDAFTRIATEMNLEARLKLDRFDMITELVLDYPFVEKTKKKLSGGTSILHLELSISILKPLRDSVFVEHFKSSYSLTLQRAFCDLPRGHLKRSFIEERVPAFFIDIVRSYAANLMQLESIPVFSKLDDFVQYDGSPIEPYTLYMISQLEGIEAWIMANNEHNLVSGYVLQRSGIPFKPLAMCRPSSVMPNTIREVLKKLYEDPTHPDLKFVLNLVLGMAGKRFNKKHYGRFTTDEAEAYHFSNDVHEFLHGFLAKKQSASVELVDGFYPLYFMIYDLQRLRLLETYRTLSKHTKILGVHTDGFFVESVPALVYHTGIKTIDDLGKLQLEGEKMTPIMHYVYKESLTKMPQLEVREPYTIVDEVESNTFIDGEIAGAGKTHVALQFLTDQSLIVIQSDKQIVAMEQRIKAQGLNAAVISYATLLGQIYEDNKLVKTKAPYNVSEHDHILLDELFQIPVQDYERIIIMLKGKSVIGTGDTFQTTTGVSYNNYPDRRRFYEETLWKLFPNRMTLKHSHRLENPSTDEPLILEIRKQLQEGASIRSVIHHFAQTDDLTQFKTHIPYTNLCAQKLERLFGDQPTHLRFRDYDKKKRPIEKSGIAVQQDADGIHYIIKDGKRQQFLRKGVVYPVKHFILQGINMVKIGDSFYNRCRFSGTHANTGHSLQGDTIDHPFCILEWNHQHASWEWFYTAITRCRRLSDVHVYTGKSLTSGTHKHIHEKLESYKITDEEAQRDFNLTAKWIQDNLKQQNYCCAACSGLLELDYEYGDPLQWSVDRRDNSLGHLQSNCRITHLKCNQAVAHQGRA